MKIYKPYIFALIPLAFYGSFLIAFMGRPVFLPGVLWAWLIGTLWLAPALFRARVMAILRNDRGRIDGDEPIISAFFSLLAITWPLTFIGWFVYVQIFKRILKECVTLYEVESALEKGAQGVR